jgi:hypothetical protein
MNDKKPEQFDKEELRLELGGSYLFAEDFIDGGVYKQYSLTIKAVFGPNTVSTQDKKVIAKPILEFENAAKRFVLNSTNQRLMRILMGTTKTSEWKGKKITLYVAGDVPAFGKVTTALRVRVPADRVPYGLRKHLGNDLTNKPVLAE